MSSEDGDSAIGGRVEASTGEEQDVQQRSATVWRLTLAITCIMFYVRLHDSNAHVAKPTIFESPRKLHNGSQDLEYSEFLKHSA